MDRMQSQRDQRVRVQAPLSAPLQPAGEQQPLSAEQFYVAKLIRSQLRLACAVAGGMLGLLVGLGALVVSWPAASQIVLAGIPLPWWLLGLAVYPLVITCAWLYRLAAERNEHRYRSITGG